MPITSPVSAEQLHRISSEANANGQRCELVEGEVRYMSPGGWLHGEVIGALHTELGSYIRQNALGKVFGAETGFLLRRDPDTVRAPDIAFVAAANVPANLPSHGYWPGAPDLAVEVISANDRAGEIDDKIQHWLAAGVRALWVIDPELQTLTVYRSSTDIVVHTRDDTIACDDPLPGFTLKVADIFS